MVVQWHITNRCNLRCTHCYQSDYEDVKELEYSDSMVVLNQIAQFKECLFPKERFILCITGGEPLLYPLFRELLIAVANSSALSGYSILTNGHFIDDNVIALFKKYPPAFVQVSLDGVKDTHEKIRGANSFYPAINGIKRLVAEKIRTSVSFTANRNNYTELLHVANLCNSLNVDHFWTDRAIPTQKNSESLRSTEVKRYIRLLRIAVLINLLHPFTKNRVSCGRALQFAALPFRKPYKCRAGASLLAILPDGDVLPCRRMEYRAGNVFTTPLTEIYTNDTLMINLRRQDTKIKNCEKCTRLHWCNGGLKCLSYYEKNDPFQKESGCFY